MAALPYASGEIVLLMHADCAYDRIWLSSMLSSFATDPEVLVLGGETTRRVSGPYSFSIALTGTLPRYSGNNG